ncbi:MAG: class I SAM-dependent methyltransferase [Planctomycetes bacterium]|nr:class I SAM-dependent methyltransferase [Planctomycetota bacterium]HRV80957.1 class I SAM-dependent methyltransferase [Planctomycetota bacterium]
MEMITPQKVHDVARFAEHLDLHHRIDGWFSVESAAAWDAMLCKQNALRAQGHMLEIGVWKGKSATLMAIHSDPTQEVVVLVDKYLDQPAIESALHNVYANLGDSFQLLKMDSRRLVLDPILVDGFEAFRWIHIDGEHSGRAVINDLSVANTLLSDQGVVCIDDYFNWLYPQVTEAVNRYVREHPDQFALFLCGYNKAYLARPHHAHTWLQYCKEELMGDLEGRGVEATLAKSTLPTEMNTFGMGPRFEGQRMRGPDWAQQTIRI